MIIGFRFDRLDKYMLSENEKKNPEVKYQAEKQIKERVMANNYILSLILGEFKNSMMIMPSILLADKIVTDGPNGEKPKEAISHEFYIRGNDINVSYILSKMKYILVNKKPDIAHEIKNKLKTDSYAIHFYIEIDNYKRADYELIVRDLGVDHVDLLKTTLNNETWENMYNNVNIALYVSNTAIR